MNRTERDVMRRLAAARPARLDPAVPADPGVRAEELALAMSGPPGASGVSPRAVAVRRVSPRWGIGLVSAAAAAAAAVVATLMGPAGDGGPGPGTSREAAPASGRDFLLAAAVRQEADGGGTDATGAFWYQRQRHGSLHRVEGGDGKSGGGGGYTVDRRSDSEYWLARDADRRWSRSTAAGTRPATADDERAWRRAGSPRAWDVAGSFEKLTRDDTALITQDAPGGATDTMPMGDLEIAELRALPTDDKALRERLHELVDAEYNAPPDTLRRLVAAKALEIAVGMPATPGLRAAAYRLLAAEPGVRSLGGTEDRSGRRGDGVAIPDQEAGTEQRIVLDRRTGAPLGTLTAATRDGHGRVKGEIIEYTTMVGQSWTDTPPPFDRDDQREMHIPYDPRKKPEPEPEPVRTARD
ncbi:CU044_5270 family protein [Streptomyces amakusaensis]|uniref:CU044_5270 family protein n=1 Tax=Streptomyces amakusaensis TaxID=67271 RepID=A0ABW0ABX8_9ACTN